MKYINPKMVMLQRGDGLVKYTATIEVERKFLWFKWVNKKAIDFNKNLYDGSFPELIGFFDTEQEAKDALQEAIEKQAIEGLRQKIVAYKEIPFELKK